jgi:hypothetical protein
LPTVTIPLESGVDDAYVVENESAWPVVGPAEVGDFKGTAFYVYASRSYVSNVSPPYSLSVGLMRFNTGAYIPSGSEVLSASINFKVYLGHLDNANGRSLTIEYKDWVGNQTDWAFNPTLRDALFGVALSSLSTTNVNSIPLENVHKISTTGKTGLRLFVSDAPSAPTGRNSVEIFGYESTDPAKVIPYLTVTYSAPPPPTAEDLLGAVRS